MSIVSFFDQFPEFCGVKIEVRGQDGYFDATQMGEAMKAFDGKTRRFNNWTRSASTQRLLNRLSVQTNIPVTRDADTPEHAKSLIDWFPGRGNRVWIHPELAGHYAEFLLAENAATESEIESSLCKTLCSFARQVKTSAGVVDVVTDTEVIEVKCVQSWKSAIGQVLVYKSYFPGKSPRIHLYGKCSDGLKSVIQSHCKNLRINLTWAE